MKLQEVGMVSISSYWEELKFSHLGFCCFKHSSCSAACLSAGRKSIKLQSQLPCSLLLDLQTWEQKGAWWDHNSKFLASYFQLNVFMKLYFPGLCSPSVNAETLQRCSLLALGELFGINSFGNYLKNFLKTAFHVKCLPEIRLRERCWPVTIGLWQVT